MQFAIISLLLHCEAFLLAFPISTVIYILFPLFALRSFFIVPYVVDGHGISRMRLLWNFQSYLWNFHSMEHNAMVHSIQFPANTGCYQFSRETDQGTIHGKGTTAIILVIHTQSTGDPRPSSHQKTTQQSEMGGLPVTDWLWFIVTSFCLTLGSDRHAGPPGETLPGAEQCRL